MGAQPRLLRKREAPERGDREPVRHTRDVVGDPLQVVGRRGAVGDQIRVVEIVVEQAAQRPEHPVVLAARLGPEIQALEHELAQPQHGATDLVRLRHVSPLARGGDDVAHKRVDPLRAGRPEQLDLGRRQVGLGEDPRAHRIVDVVVDVGDPVDEPHHAPLERRGLLRPGVVEDPVAHRLGQVQPLPVTLEHVHHPQRVAIVLEPPRPPLAQRSVERLLADVAEGRMAQVVSEPDRLGQVLVQPQRPRHRACDAASLERVREPPKCLRVHDPVAIALKRRAQRAVGLGLAADRRIGARRALPEELALRALDPFPEGIGFLLTEFAQAQLSIRAPDPSPRGSPSPRKTR